MDDTLKESTFTLNQLQQLLQRIETEPTTSFEQERKAYLTSLQERKKSIEKEIQRESDTMDEYYAKKTRDSIYRHLVGAWKTT